MKIIKKIDVGVQPARSSGREAHEMFPAPHSQSSAWHANINFIFTDTFFNSREGLRQKARTARSLPKSRN